MKRCHSRFHTRDFPNLVKLVGRIGAEGVIRRTPMTKEAGYAFGSQPALRAGAAKRGACG
jgi:hypothetical protein